MRLAAFSVGRIRTQLIDGERVRTAYVKTPVPEPWVITPTGPAGDEVAVHSDHLYAFDRASYDYWAEHLGAQREEWGDGHFAENLTFDTLDQTQLRVGDRYRLGSATIVVTGPRVPCWKLTWRLGQPKTFMRRFRLSGRSGAYFGVLEPGVVHPGDELVLIGGGESAPTVAELSQLCDSGTSISAPQRETIERALASEHLSETVRGTLTLKLAGLDTQAVPGVWRGWRPFQIDEIVDEAPDVRSFSLRPSDDGILPAFRAGQHVVVRLSAPGALPIVRTWSLSDFDGDPTRYRITVKRLAEGRGSGALFRAADGALHVELRSPSGRFRLDRGSFRPVVLIAAGIGITPMIAMIRSHLARDHMPPLWLIYGSRTPEHTAFRDELDALFASQDDLHLYHFYSADPVDETPDAANVHRGRISAERVIEVMRGNYLPVPEGRASIPWFESDMYLCGPRAFNDAVQEGLVAAGANPDHVFAEEFAENTVDAAAPRRQTDATVVYATRGLETTWVAAQEQTLLELAEEGGLELPSDCRSGTCRTCESTLVVGDVDRGVTVAVDGTRRALLCIAYPLSDLVVVEPPDEVEL